MSKSCKKYSVKTLGKDFVTILGTVVEALNDHEGRLQVLEAPDLKGALRVIMGAIGNIEDPEKSVAVLEQFRKVCDALGVVDLEVS
ncbi:MAG: hypothetical protein NWF00_04985 [Candidatus Bathyarchaeota archaeon]|nr:hypothetical protein [Candidatus Bathyarchaeota archaeon]